MGHARAIINIDDRQKQVKIMNLIIKKGLSVREVELIVRNINNPEQAKKDKVMLLPERYTEISKNLTDKLNTKVELKRNNKGKGSIVIPFSSDEELEKIIEALE